MIRYVFREVVPLKNAGNLDAQKVGDTLSQIFKATPDLDQTDAVWQAAQNPKHYLHGCFEWDVHKAAESHWRHTARQIITSIRVIDEDGNEDRPAFISISSPDHGGTRYRHVTEIAKNRDFQLQVMKAAKRDLAAWQRRYQALSDVCAIVVDAEEALARKIAREETKAAKPVRKAA